MPVNACSFAVSQASDLALLVGYVAKEDFFQLFRKVEMSSSLESVFTANEDAIGLFQKKSDIHHPMKMINIFI